MVIVMAIVVIVIIVMVVVMIFGGVIGNTIPVMVVIVKLALSLHLFKFGLVYEAAIIHFRPASGKSQSSQSKSG
ncbi:MAG: hypothetical protein AAF559_11680 [Pseudomonadota bacterium]